MSAPTKIVCFPGQIAFNIRQGLDRFSYLVEMSFGPANPCKEFYPNGVMISRKDTADTIRGLRREIRKRTELSLI